MNIRFSHVVFLFCITIIIGLSCSKGGNTYTTTDHTVGMVKVRLWSGHAYGNARGDTLEGSNQFSWPKPYSYFLTDTSFSVLRINGFSIDVAGTRLSFRTVDSVTKIVTFDSVYANSARSFLTWNFGTDIMHYELHKVLGHNDSTTLLYETNYILDSH